MIRKSKERTRSTVRSRARKMCLIVISVKGFRIKRKWRLKTQPNLFSDAAAEKTS